MHRVFPSLNDVGMFGLEEKESARELKGLTGSFPIKSCSLFPCPSCCNLSFDEFWLSSHSLHQNCCKESAGNTPTRLQN